MVVKPAKPFAASSFGSTTAYTSPVFDFIKAIQVLVVPNWCNTNRRIHTNRRESPVTEKHHEYEICWSIISHLEISDEVETHKHK